MDAGTVTEIAEGEADLAIVGAGAAGLAAAIFAAETAPAARIVVLEGARSIGAKILVSGGGRCNVTHHEVTPEDFNGVRPVVRNVLAAFGVPATVAWFQSLGVELKREETGKLFPTSNKAATVVGALVGRCRALGVTLATGHRVRALTRADDDRLRIEHGHGALLTRRVVMATGGRSLPKSGSDGAGWEMLGALGHTVTATHQALVPLVFAPDTPFGELAGISHPAELTLTADGTRRDRRSGSLLWTHVGVSGPVVMDASRHWVIAAAEGARSELTMSLFPGESFESVDRRFTAIARERPKLSLARLVAELVPERAAAAFVRLAGIEPTTPNARLGRDERRRLVGALTATVLPVERPRGWNYAEVTAGGVPLAEIDYRTMASRVVPGLHVIGEMLDCDGRIGGFNFQWAWATGHLAGRAAARALRDPRRSPIMKTTDPADLGLDPERLARLTDTIAADVGAERYDGAVVLVARGGQVALHEAIGWADRVTRRRAAVDDVFSIFSVTKTLTTAALLIRVDRGELSLTTPVAEVLPEFGNRGKQRITVAQLLTHTAGLAAGIPPLAPEHLGNLEAFVAAASRQALEAAPGVTVHYSAITAHALLAEVVRRLDGGTRRFRDILAADVLTPLGMRDTALGLRPDLAKRKVPVVVRDRSPGIFDPDLLEAFNVLVTAESEIPAASAVSTVADLFQWSECLRREGELDGHRLFAPALVRLATTNHTGERPNGFYAFACEQRGWDPFPAYIGLSFWLRGQGIFPTYFGLTASPRTFGGLGAGSSMFWVDPEHDLTFVLLTAGLLEETRNLDRCQRLSDLVQAAVID